MAVRYIPHSTSDLTTGATPQAKPSIGELHACVENLLVLPDIGGKSTGACFFAVFAAVTVIIDEDACSGYLESMKASLAFSLPLKAGCCTENVEELSPRSRSMAEGPDGLLCRVLASADADCLMGGSTGGSPHFGEAGGASSVRCDNDKGKRSKLASCGD